MSILEKVFNDQELFNKLTKWVESPMNQPEKAEKFEKNLKSVGLKPFAMGTNRQIYIHKDYPKAVFKIALDEQGVLDNLNEYQKSDLSEHFPASFDIDNDGYILVQRKWKEIPYGEFSKRETQKEVRKVLEKLSDDFALIDCGLDKHKNFGISPDGVIGLIDFGYVEIAELANFNCPHVRPSTKDRTKMKYCKGKLHYNKSFTMMKCDECENVFRPDVILEGYTLNRWDTDDTKKTKLDRYAPSDELKDFYMHFEKTRDRSTLKKYVELSNNTKANQNNMKGDFNEMESKNEFLERARRLAGRQSHIHDAPDTMIAFAATRNETQKRNPSLKYYNSTPYGIDVLRPHDEVENSLSDCKDEDEVYNVSPDTVVSDDYMEESIEESIEEAIDEFHFSDAVKKLTRSGISEDETNEIISQLFFTRFPEVKEVLDGIKNKMKKELQENDTETGHHHYGKIFKEANIELVRPVTYPDQLHIAFSVDDLNANPWVVMSKGDTVVHIDLRAHMNQLTQVDTQNETDLIVTEMIVAPLSEFDEDYESSYFGTSENDD